MKLAIKIVSVAFAIVAMLSLQGCDTLYMDNYRSYDGYNNGGYYSYNYDNGYYGRGYHHHAYYRYNHGHHGYGRHHYY